MSEPTQTSKMPLWLIGSVLINVLLVGLILGHLLAGGQKQMPSHAHAPPEARIAESIMRSTAPEDRRAARRAFGEVLRANRGVREERDAARRELAALIVAEPYDQAAVEAAFATFRGVDDDLRAAMHEALAAQLGALDAEQRKAIADGVRSRERGRRGFRRDRPAPD
ncbi:MAG: periplasmic heavy metal sensor [Pseudomonadota bacterium]